MPTARAEASCAVCRERKASRTFCAHSRTRVTTELPMLRARVCVCVCVCVLFVCMSGVQVSLSSVGVQ